MVNPGPVATDRMLKIMKRKAIDILGDETRWEELYDHYLSLEQSQNYFFQALPKLQNYLPQI